MDDQTFRLIMSRFDTLEDGIKSINDTLDPRISSLETTRTKQHGIMIGGGALVTFFAGMFSWVINHVWPHS